MNSVLNNVAVALAHDAEWDYVAPASIAGGRNMASARLAEAARVDDPVPLTVADVRRIFSLRKIVECDLARRATPLLRPLDLERLDRHIRLLSEPRANAAVAASAYESFILGLLWPAASNAELHTVRSLITTVGGAVQSELDRPGPRSFDLVACRGGLGRVLRAFQVGDPSRVEVALLGHLDVAERLTVRLILTQEVGSAG